MKKRGRDVKQLINKIKNNKYTKYIIVFIIVFSISFGGIFFLINDLSNHIEDKKINYTDFTVVDTYISENNSNDYIIVSDDNQSYEIINDKDGTNMFNRIEIGHHYHFVVRNDSTCKYLHIIQVYNERK